MACAAPAWTNGTHWFLFVVVTAFVATSLWCFIYLLSLREAINLPIDWLLTELILTALFAVLYIIASIVQIATSVTKPRPPVRLQPFYITAGEEVDVGHLTGMWLGDGKLIKLEGSLHCASSLKCHDRREQNYALPS
ncbi:Marvel domain [Trinorchestia longiramus]|nr:Marvel domain [Trinorchestia longiramus]